MTKSMVCAIGALALGGCVGSSFSDEGSGVSETEQSAPERLRDTSQAALYQEAIMLWKQRVQAYNSALVERLELAPEAAEKARSVLNAAIEQRVSQLAERENGGPELDRASPSQIDVQRELRAVLAPEEFERYASIRETFRHRTPTSALRRQP